MNNNEKKTLNMDNLGERERRIMRIVLGNSRLSNSELALKAGVSRKQVEYFLEKMRSNGTIPNFLTRIRQDCFCTGIALVLWKLRHPKKTRAALCDSFSKEKRINWIAELEGTFQLATTIQFRSPGDVETVLSEIRSANKDFIIDTKTLIYTHDYFFDRSGLFGHASKTESNAFQGIHRQLDRMEIKVLQELALHGRETHSQIAKKIGTSPPTVRRCIQKLKNQGVIQGFTASVRMSRLGFSGIHLSLDVDPLEVPALAEFAANSELVSHCARTVGDYSIVMTLYVRSLKELYEFLDGLSERFGHAITAQQQHHVRDELKEVFVNPEFIV
jgi:Lrp/AsnC family leucine-responsive transcriptional regulator